MSRVIHRVPVDYRFNGEPGVKPPPGDAYQVWQNVDEGTPISPVFNTEDECVAWLVDHEECSPEAARKFIANGWAPSFIGSRLGLFTGVQMAAGVEAHLAHIAPPDSVPPGTRIRHVASGPPGTIVARMPMSNHEYYIVDWDHALPDLVEPDDDPNAQMRASCKSDGFEVQPA